MEAINFVILKVAEARSQDVGRCIARLDPAMMEQLDVCAGDIIQLEGGRRSAVRAMPTYPEMRRQGIIQIDGITRENTQASLGKMLKVTKASPCEAQRIILSGGNSLSTEEVQKANYIRLLHRQLDDHPCLKGDRLRIHLFGANYAEFRVQETFPEDITVVTSRTRIEIKDQQHKESFKTKVTYEDVGGLRKQLDKIREMIELPLKHPELFVRLGIEAPKGILMFGPPGTGKTLLARCVANETDAFFLHVAGPEITRKYYGESEGYLREIFEKAKNNAPSIVFLDEIDAIAPKREEVQGEVEKRVVAQLLALMDGLDPRGKVIVIGATNIPNALDPALRRPGRFDREINLGVPDTQGRLEILQVHTRGMPLQNDVDLQELARHTYGFVGADLEVLCKEAAMHALKKIVPLINSSWDYIPEDILHNLTVSMQDFLLAVNEIEPSSIREALLELPDVSWDDVGGLQDVKQELIEAIEWPLLYPDECKQLKIKPPKGILLYGPPGTGKTLLAKVIAKRVNANFFSVKGPELFSKWAGESEKGLREIFKKAKQAAPSIVFFDEIDALASNKSKAGGAEVANRVISQLLTELDGVEELNRVIVIGATNCIDLLDQSLLRAGRLELHLYLQAPDYHGRLEILKIHTRNKPLDVGVNIEQLASSTTGWTGADLNALCQRAARMALKRHLMGQPGPDGLSSLQIEAGDFAAALSYVRNLREAAEKRSEN